MGELYKLSGSNNSEIKFRWIRLGIRARWEDAIPRAVQMVTEQGRMKFLRPIYRLKPHSQVWNRFDDINLQGRVDYP
jgi:hypothetical protein